MNNSNDFILNLFNRRCIGLFEPCFKFTTEIHEIEPRSSGKSPMFWKNRVTLCHEHHMEFHRLGGSKELKDILRKRREDYLKAIGKENYV
jgi:hypothetical protein